MLIRKLDILKKASTKGFTAETLREVEEAPFGFLCKGQNRLKRWIVCFNMLSWCRRDISKDQEFIYYLHSCKAQLCPFIDLVICLATISRIPRNWRLEYSRSTYMAGARVFHKHIFHLFVCLLPVLGRSSAS